RLDVSACLLWSLTFYLYGAHRALHSFPTRRSSDLLAHGDDVQRPLVTERRTDLLEDPRDRLQVVGEHLGAGLEHLLKVLPVALDVIDEQLDPGAGVHRVYLFTGAGEQAVRTVGQIFVGPHGEGCVAHPDLLTLWDALKGRHRVIRDGIAGGNGAEVAAALAGVHADEEGGLAILPALEDVGTARFLAHGVQPLA